ncbi:hypothetical protein SSPS47_20090 [Streptomyces sp. S4.7]|uniref:hypothetical protein n=1 Tax=unclassified Streptomyces TaxID=2593676 RepID=UPI0011CAD4F0|nr:MULTISPECIES: hypothetical protein [unclassified Streptomyces]QHY97410.1 hypothetical protein SSPS47_20090 [Streptomyces sp. S4.7]TXL90479.1 hypothetical protein EW053_11705 [Streptomyces sp. IB2014 016-6]
MTGDARRPEEVHGPEDARRDAAVRRASAALETYTLSGDGWRRSPGETLSRVLADLMLWSEDTQRDFDDALSRARDLRAAERRG